MQITDAETKKPSLLARFEATRPFTENEAWMLFRLVALAEAVGWTLLIAGIVIQRYHLPGSHYAVPIAGQVHGTIFLAYFAIVLATYSSSRWSRQKFVVAVLAGVPPYGTLLFEQWASRQRQANLSRIYFRSIVLASVPGTDTTEQPGKPEYSPAA